MIKCPNCNELLGENVEKCPFCWNPVTEEYKRKVRAELEKAREDATFEAIAEYRTRTERGVLVFLIAVVAYIFGTIAIVMSGVDDKWALIWIIAVSVAYAFFTVKFRVGVCPYCESDMNDRIYYRRYYPRVLDSRSYCPRCGGRLR